MPSRFSLLLVALVYAAASWLIYGWTLGAPFLLDDQATIQNNPAIRALALHEVLTPPPTPVGFSRRPVANLTMALNYATGDLRIEGYRVFNLSLHAFNAFLLFLFARLVAGRIAGLQTQSAWWAAFLAGILWIVHPLSTSAVHYLTQRPELLLGGAFLGMFYAQTRALFSVHPRRWLFAAWAACLLAAGSKESMVILPFVAVLFDRCATRWSWGEQFRKRGFYYLLLLATLVWPFVLLFRDDSGLVLNVGLEERWAYFLTVSEGVVRHVTMLFWPRGLVFDYGTQLVRGTGDVLFPLATVVVAFAAILWGLHRRSLAAWVGAAVVALLLPSWINMVTGQPVAEHRFYLPGGLLLALVCVGAAVLVGRSPRLRLPAVLAAVAVCLLFALLAVQRAALYVKPSALISSDVRTWPRGDRNYLNLGIVYEMEENFEAAARNYQLSATPWERANWRPIIAMARIELRKGNEERAVFLASEGLRRVVSIQGAPDLRDFSGTLAGSFRAAGRVGASLPVLRQAAASGREKDFLRNMILQISAETGDMKQAEAQFREGGAENPVMRMNYAIALARSGRIEEAIAEMDAMIGEAPKDSDPRRLADVHALKGAMLGQTRAAAEALDSALQFDPSHGEALNNLAWLLATTDDESLRDTSRAVELARMACRLQPSTTNFRGTLAVALAANGQDDKAATEFEEAQRLGRINSDASPNLPEAFRAASEQGKRNH